MLEVRLTIRDVAKVAGFHFTTVSLALKGSSQIPELTRRKIRRIADRMGYRPDPMLSALNAYRHAKKPSKYRATIAWINNWPKREALYALTGFKEYYEGAKKLAEQKGYVLEEFWVGDPSMNPKRMTGVLRARNIEAILLAPQPRAKMNLKFDFEKFAVLALGYSLQPAVFHVVTNHHFHSMNLITSQLVDRGYRRIGLFATENWNEKVENGWFGGLALAQMKNPDLEHVTPLFQEGITDDEFAYWLETQKPDVVVSATGALKRIRNFGYDVPGDIGFASLSLSRDDRTTSGIYQNDFRVGAAATEFIISMLHSGERGIPDLPTRLLIESEWRSGETLCEPTRKRSV